MHHLRFRELRDELRQRCTDGREQLEQLAEARHAVVGREEVREDEAAADRAGEDDAVAGRRARERGEDAGVR